MKTIETALREELDEISQSALARKVKLSPQMICDIIAGRRDYSPKLLKYLGFKRVVSYEPIRQR